MIVVPGLGNGAPWQTAAALLVAATTVTYAGVFRRNKDGHSICLSLATRSARVILLLSRLTASNCGRGEDDTRQVQEANRQPEGKNRASDDDKRDNTRPMGRKKDWECRGDGRESDNEPPRVLIGWRIILGDEDDEQSREACGHQSGNAHQSPCMRLQRMRQRGSQRMAPGGIEPPRADSKSAALSTELRGLEPRRGSPEA